jgi:hypothetical protein
MKTPRPAGLLPQPRPTPVIRSRPVVELKLKTDALPGDTTWEGGGPRTLLVPPHKSRGSWQ